MDIYMTIYEWVALLFMVAVVIFTIGYIIGFLKAEWIFKPNYHTGVIEDVTLWPRALKSEEIKQIYHDTK